LAFCLRKSKVDLKGMKTEVTPTVERNKEGYWRVVKMSAKIKVEVGESTESSRLQRCLEIFENYCVVTGAVRNGIKVDVKVNSTTSDGSTTETQKATT